jgi:hypothetical protein
VRLTDEPITRLFRMVGNLHAKYKPMGREKNEERTKEYRLKQR